MRRRRTLPSALRRQIVSEQWAFCDACHDPLEAGTAEIDHIVPVACGGTDDPQNLHALCPNCHARKTRSEPAVRRRLARCGPGVGVCWVCCQTISLHFPHSCTGVYWYAPKKN